MLEGWAMGGTSEEYIHQKIIQKQFLAYTLNIDNHNLFNEIAKVYFYFSHQRHLLFGLVEYFFFNTMGYF